MFRTVRCVAQIELRSPKNPVSSASSSFLRIVLGGTAYPAVAEERWHSKLFLLISELQLSQHDKQLASVPVNTAGKQNI